MKLDRDQLPLYFEGLRLKRWLAASGWPLAVVGAVVGVTLAGTVRSPLADGAGLVLGVASALVVAGLLRCRRCEIVIGPSLLTFGAGPFRRRVPAAWLEHGQLRPATSWRRLYADRELLFELPDHEGSFILPTAEPEALQAALLEARTASRTRPFS
jgi:hypothetical protein